MHTFIVPKTTMSCSLVYFTLLAYRVAHHEMNVVVGNIAEASINKEDPIETPERYMVDRGSLKSKLPPTLIIKSANLRVLDPVGQGICNKLSLLAYAINTHHYTTM